MVDPGLAAVVEACRSARRVVCVTGAGVSRGSGVPTYRDAMEGLWARYRPEDLATPEAFAADPALVTRWYDQRRLACMKCAPNAAHVAIAAWQRRVEAMDGGSFTLITQNVDDLHERAGCPPGSVHHVHGTMFRWFDPATGLRVDAFGGEPLVKGGDYPPVSEDGGAMRPDIVWFGESLPMEVMEVAAGALAECAVFVSAGTSGVVHPVAGFVHAVGRGAVTVEVNPEATPMSGAFDYGVRMRAEEALPVLAGVAAEEGGGGES
ncbi:MAG: NAD-dependent deacylase [Planctomycetota bacterium]